MADRRHAFVPSDGNPKFCGYLVKTRNVDDRWGAQTCGLPVGNVAVHAPGCKPAQPERPHLMVVPNLAS